MTEREKAIKIAHSLLGRPWTDPEDYECVLARQFLQSVERERQLNEEADSLARQLQA